MGNDSGHGRQGFFDSSRAPSGTNHEHLSLASNRLRSLIGGIQRSVGRKIVTEQSGTPTFFDNLMLSVLRHLRESDRRTRDGQTRDAIDVLVAYQLLKDQPRFADFSSRAAETKTRNRLVWELGDPQLSASQGVDECLSWRGLSLFKTVFDFAIYSMLLWELKPATIIELGSGTGASALWLADLLRIFGIEGHVYSADLNRPNLEDPRISFIRGDCSHIENVFPRLLIDNFPHPWLLIEDMHVNTPAVLLYFSDFFRIGDYLVVEDSRSKQVDLERFFAKHGADFKVDTRFTDFFGRNATCSIDSIFVKV
ncbi:MAG: hypothetical protein M3O31_06590 [Acidobacteriota bacterium]|nr:hypothetical protein [Acidobacteriota bacterium]